MEKTSPGISKLINGVRIFLEIICGVFLILLSIVVLCRFLTDLFFIEALPGLEESAIYMMIWMVFLGASINILKGSNVRIDFFVALLPAKAQKFLDAGLPDHLSCVYRDYVQEILADY